MRRAVSTVIWDIHNDNEYVLVGDGVTLDLNRLDPLVTGTFADLSLFISADRNNGYSTTRANISAEITKLLEISANLLICNTSTKTFMQVHKVGVAHTGQAQSNYAIKGTSVETLDSSELSSGASVPYFGC